MNNLYSSAISDSDYESVKRLLGRSPRGLKAIAVRSVGGDPVVIQVSSLINQKPFPTLFWLVDKQLNYAIDQLEAGGLIAELQSSINQSESLRSALVNDHESYIALRNQLMDSGQKQAALELGFAEVLQRRGIGGIENFSRVRCLHTYYAAHLVVRNTVGAMVDNYWQAQGTGFSHLPSICR